MLALLLESSVSSICEWTTKNALEMKIDGQKTGYGFKPDLEEPNTT
jgi:hypothetical protein